jgi:uncharacterized protein (DUF1800 family)
MAGARPLSEGEIEMEYRDAAHLFRRMAFGARPDQIQALAGLTPEAAVDQLLNFDSVDNSKMEKALRALIHADSQDFDAGRRWWLTRMILTAAPFQEKMTLFWHNHFATSDAKVFGPLVGYQNLTLRTLALARFDDLLLGILKDPAMLYFLDNTFSTKDRPNENLAREMQELFTLGIKGPQGDNYTQADVKAVAQALTGWSITIARGGFVTFNPRKANPWAFLFEDVFHDHSLKSIYGLPPADLNADDVVRIIAARPAAAAFLVKKLFAFFVFPLDDSDPADQAIIDQFAQVYMDNDHSILALVRSVFTSEVFYSSRARFALIKNPVELIVGSTRMLNADYQDIGTEPALITQPQLHQAAAGMGMKLLEPPDVSGWKFGQAWIGTSTLLERYNFATALMGNRTSDHSQPEPFVSNETLKSYVKSSAADTVASFLNLLGPLDVDQATADRLAKYLETDAQGNPVTFVPDDATIDRQVRGLVRHIMYLAEFQLN